jgi:hypothetical protein
MRKQPQKRMLWHFHKAGFNKRLNGVKTVEPFAVDD